MWERRKDNQRGGEAELDGARGNRRPRSAEPRTVGDAHVSRPKSMSKQPKSREDSTNHHSLTYQFSLMIQPPPPNSKKVK